MNALVHKRFDSPAAMASYAHVLARAADAIPVGSGGLPILKLEQEGKDAGYFNFGEDATPVSDEDLWAINPFHILRGYICFSQKNEVLGEVLRPITAEPVDFDKLPVHYGRDKRGKEIELDWQPQIVLHMQCIAGPNEGAAVTFKPTSGGGLKLCRTVLHEIAKRFAKGTDKPVPTGYLSAEGYTHKGFNKKIWNPLLDFDKWVDMEFADAEGTTSIDDVEEDERAHAVHNSDVRKKADDELLDAALRGDTKRVGDLTRSRSRDAEDAEVIEDEPKRGRGRPRKEDAEEDAPRSRSRSRDDEPAEEPRSRTRGRPAAEDDAEDAPRSRGRSAPAPRRGAREEAEEDAPRSRGRGRDAEEDDAPRSRGGRQSRR